MSTQLFPRPVGDVGLGAFAEEGPVVTLQDLAELDMRVTWDEAVAIVEELCVAAQGSVMRPIPAPGDIILNANGTVGLRHSSAGVPDPVEAARRLHELLGGSVAPAPLRLFVSQAVSSGHYDSLSEFADALAYFAKPGRQERLKAVYQRATEQLPLKPQPASASVRPVVRNTSTPTPKAASLFARHRSWQRLALIGLAAASTASAVVTLAFYGWPKGQPAAPAALAAPAPEVTVEPADSGPAAASAAATPAPAPAKGRTPAVNETLILGGRPALDALSMPLTGSAAAINYRGPRGPRQGTGGQTSAAAAAAATFVLPTPAAGPSQPAGPLAPTTATAGVRLQSQGQTQPVSGSAPAAAPPSAEGQPIYSPGDAAVQPAVLSKPQILPPPFASGGGRPVRIELIVSPTGTVERARFLEAPQRMADMMLLSSAKTWIFTPAMKDGQPVRYRTVLSWVGAP